MSEEHRKKPQEIKMMITDICWAKAENKKVIADKLKSNWATIGKYAEELVNDGVLEKVVISNLIGYKVKTIIKDILFYQQSEHDARLNEITFPREISKEIWREKKEVGEGK
jgi:predicted transcriptional regulator